MGSKRAMRDMTEMVTECGINPEYPVIPIFAQNDRNCQEYVASLKNAGCVGAMQAPQGIGATIGSYIGPILATAAGSRPPRARYSSVSRQAISRTLPRSCSSLRAISSAVHP